MRFIFGSLASLELFFRPLFSRCAPTQIIQNRSGTFIHKFLRIRRSIWHFLCRNQFYSSNFVRFSSIAKIVVLASIWNLELDLNSIWKSRLRKRFVWWRRRSTLDLRLVSLKRSRSPESESVFSDLEICSNDPGQFTFLCQIGTQNVPERTKPYWSI